MMREDSARPARRSYFAGSGSVLIWPVDMLTRKTFFIAQPYSPALGPPPAAAPRARAASRRAWGMVPTGRGLANRSVAERRCYVQGPGNRRPPAAGQRRREGDGQNRPGLWPI